MVDDDAVRDRAHVEYLEPPIADVSEPFWRAEDRETGCVGIGRVESEAAGNLVAAVAAYEESTDETPLTKLPGETIERIDPQAADDGLVSRLSDLLP